VVEILDPGSQAPGYSQEVEALSPAEILEEALKLSLSEQEEIANRLAHCILGELQAKSGRLAI
jgi:hypothetical protein